MRDSESMTRAAGAGSGPSSDAGEPPAAGRPIGTWRYGALEA
jgi:hypothetical protein